MYKRLVTFSVLLLITLLTFASTSTGLFWGSGSQTALTHPPAANASNIWGSLVKGALAQVAETPTTEPTPGPTPTGGTSPLPTPTLTPTPTPTQSGSPLPTPTNTTIPAPTGMPPTGADLTQRRNAMQSASDSDEYVAAAAGEIDQEVQAAIHAAQSVIYPVRLAAPALKLDTPVRFMAWREVTKRNNQVATIWHTVDNAAGWHINSLAPGQGGNVVMSGHNNIGGAVFRKLDRLKPGDELTVWNNDEQKYSYIVEKVMIVPEKYASSEQREANAAWIAPTNDERLTLVTCWPAYSDTHRVIVVARPVKYSF